jgi:hypothetical protein
MPAYSTITIDRAAFRDPDGVLTPVPAPALGVPGELTPTDLVVPQGLSFSDAVPPTTDVPAFVLAIHATDPIVGPPVDDPATALSTIIGLQVRTPGVYDDVEVPIFPTPQVLGPERLSNRLQDGQTLPPNPEGSTEITGTFWRFEYPDAEPPFPTPITVDGEPIQATATVESLDRNDALPVLGPDDLTLPDDGEIDDPPR